MSEAALDPPGQTGRLSPPDGWIPVDRRWLGLDRRTVRPAVIVLALALVMIFIVPVIDQLVPSGRPVRTGERIGLAGNVQFSPAAGWLLRDGVAVGNPTRAGEYPTSAEVTEGPTAFALTTGNFAGTPTQLLTQVTSTAQGGGGGPSVIGDPEIIQTTAGDSGAVVATRTATSNGLIATFVLHGTGVEITVVGLTESAASTSQVEAMVRSVSPLQASR